MHFYFPFPPYSLSHISLPNLLKIHSFFITNWYWNHVCIYILKYYLLRPNKSTCMYAFRVDCFALGNQLLCSSWGKTTSTIPNFGIAAACKSLNGWSLVVFAKYTFACPLELSVMWSHLGIQVSETLLL